VIEVVGAGRNGEQILRREIVDEFSPKRAKAKAHQAFENWKRRGATGVRVLNHLDEEIYRL
jgi:hypothetical protein